MKISKSLFLAFAGLGLFACSNEDVTENGGIQGVADVTVKIDLPGLTGSRAVGAYTSSEAVNPDYISITLDAAQGGTTKSGKYSDLVFGGVCTFEGVQDPKSLTVEINTKTGEGYVTDVPYGTIQELNQIAVANTRMTGSTNTFVAGDNKYTATVTMDHTMARIEVGGIKHAAHSDGKCKFSAGNLTGVMLNNIVLENDDDVAKVYNESEIDNYFGSSFQPGLWDKLTADNQFFPNAAGPFPANSGETAQCYAYNIYPALGAENLPVLTLYFTGMQAAAGSPVYVGDNGFAFVKQYKVAKSAVDDNATLKEALCGESATDLGEGFYKVVNFPAGYIYKITDLAVPDDAIHTTPDGSGLNLEATITITEWKIVEGSADWTEVEE